MKLLVLLGVMATVACDKVIKEDRLPPRAEIREISCTTPGICGGFNADGTFGVGFRLSCPGHQQALVRVVEVHRTYESGAVSTFEDVDVQSRSTRCEQ